ASIVSYGSGAGGSRAAEHLRGVLGEVRIYDLREQLLLPNYWNQLNDQGEYQFTDDEVEQANTLIDDTVFWATRMQPIREEVLGLVPASSNGSSGYPQPGGVPHLCQPTAPATRPGPAPPSLN